MCRRAGRAVAIAVAYLNLLGHAVGWPSPRGGAQALTDALVGYLTDLGGAVRTGALVTGVDAIARSGHRACGSPAASGSWPHDGDRGRDASRAAGARGRRIYRACYRRLLARYRYGPATVKVDWALDGPIPWLAEQVRGAGTVHVGGSEDELVETHRHLRACGCPERPFLLLGQQTVADPTRAPGRQAHRVGLHARPRSRRGLGAPSLTGTWSASRRRSSVTRPAFRDRILARHVLGPAGLQERNPNLVGGDVGGGSYRLDQVIFRPVPSLSPYRTPLRGLYLGRRRVPGRRGARRAR